jgi:transcriptional regulator with XRE-family HTH domain
MPRWRPLPEELDPQIREFTSQLRRLVDRSGMSVATVADRTGYSKSSWEKYLGGRLLPPRGAAHALAEVTDTDIRHLETMWELAERAWSRAEMRHDVTMEAIRVAQAREALGEFWDEPAKGKKRPRNKAKAKGGADGGNQAGKKGKGVSRGDAPAGSEGDAEPLNTRGPAASSAAPPSASELQGSGAASGRAERPEFEKPPGDDHTAMLRPLPRRGAARERQRVDLGAWPATQERPPAAESDSSGTYVLGSVASLRKAAEGAAAPGAAVSPGASVPPGGPQGPVPQTAPQDPERASRKVRYAALFAGAAGAFAVIAVGVLMFGLPGVTDNSNASPKPSPSTTAPNLPAGVKCQGEDCIGKDPEEMGCGGQNVKSSSSAFVGPSMVEVRYSKVCKAAWGRITGAAQGDGLKISAGGHAESDEVGSTNDAYTEMVAVSSATEARACATLAAGTTGCTEPGGVAETGGAAESGDGTEPSAPAAQPSNP